MTTTITQAFELPERHEITALGFVVRLEDDTAAEVQRRLVADYVITPKVREELPLILDQVRGAWQRGEDIGRFIHGSFGSGKSHFMALLGLMLEDAEVAWGKSDPLVAELAGRHRAWIRDARLLVVRLHMLTASGRDTGFDRAVYEAVNATLRRRGKAPFEFLYTEGVLAEARREADLFGDVFWQRLANDGIVGSREEFDGLAGGSPQDREDLARAYLEWKGRSTSAAGIDPNWAEGLQRLARHVKAQGFEGVVLLVDELLLWLSEKTPGEFKRAINQLTVLVDHNDGRRALPMNVFVARQRNIAEFFPDLVREQEIHEHLTHNAQRFGQTTLEDVELRHIVRQRLLKRRLEAEVAAVVDALAERHRRILPVLLAGADPAYVRDVYPFHPALIEMLIDVSSLMQRERTALRLLTELLVVHYPELPLGKFLPAGSAFAAVFPESGVEGTKKVEDLRAIHRLYYQQLRPAMRRMVEEEGEGRLDETRSKVLDQIVKTALLAEVSPRLKGATSVTVSRLVQLNDADVVGDTERGKVLRVREDLVLLSRRVPAVQVSGTGADSKVSVALHSANLAELLDRARSRVDSENRRFQTFMAVIQDLLGLALIPGFGVDAPFEGLYTVKWRGTSRSGWVGIKNVRLQPNAEFKPRDGESFRILIDWPWDDPGHSVEEDRQRAREVRRREGVFPTICWLPRHFSPAEMELLADLCAAEYLARCKPDDELVSSLGESDRKLVIEQAATRVGMLTGSLRDTLFEVYKDHGEVAALQGEGTMNVPEVDLPRNLRHFAEVLLDRQFPGHPHLGVDPRPRELERLCEWLTKAAEEPDQTRTHEEDDLRLLRGLGVPLELVDVGQARARLRRDGRYLKLVLDMAADETVSWSPIDGELMKLGFDPEVRSFFLVLLARLGGFRVVNAVSGAAVDLVIDRRAREGVKLVRAPLLELAEWSRLRELARGLLEVDAPSQHRTLAEQDRAAQALKVAAEGRRKALSDLHQRLGELGADGPGRLADIREALARLAPLEGSELDTCGRLRAFLAKWPEEGEARSGESVRKAAAMARALQDLDRPAKSHLEASAARGVTEAKAHVEDLRRLLSASEAERPLTQAAIAAWNDEVHQILNRIIVGSPQPQPPVPLPPTSAPPAPGVSAPPAGEAVIVRGQVIDARDERFWKDLRRKVAERGDRVEIDVIVRPVKG